MNKVYLIGNLTRDTELSETASGVKCCRFSIAVNRNYTGNDGEKAVDFFNIITWRGQAENCYKYLQKGSKVAIVGSLQNRSYEDKYGDKKTITEIVASEVEFLTQTDKTDKPQPPKPPQEPKQCTLEECTDDDLPF